MICIACAVIVCVDDCSGEARCQAIATKSHTIYIERRSQAFENTLALSLLRRASNKKCAGDLRSRFFRGTGAFLPNSAFFSPGRSAEGHHKDPDQRHAVKALKRAARNVRCSGPLPDCRKDVIVRERRYRSVRAMSHQRSGLKAARSSLLKTSGCSQAAKWPPFSNRL